MRSSPPLLTVLAALVALSLIASACSDETAAPADNGEGSTPGSAVDGNNPSPSSSTPSGSASGSEDDGGLEHDGDAAPKSSPDANAVVCKKTLTVIFTVGVPGMSKIASNGCWTPVITDGAAVKDYRKCSTSTFQVSNPTGTSYAYDDTNPEHSLTQEKSFLASCAAGATGDGYEFMAYRGGWRMLAASHLRATFSELYTSTMTDIDSFYNTAGVYDGNSDLAGKINVSVWPMINFGPPASANLHAKVGSETLKICKTLPTNGYIGMYNASWADGMAANDSRLVAIEDSLNTCTTQ